jgi:hypothetical protein
MCRRSVVVFLALVCLAAMAFVAEPVAAWFQLPRPDTELCTHGVRGGVIRLRLRTVGRIDDFPFQQIQAVVLGYARAPRPTAGAARGA